MPRIIRAHDVVDVLSDAGFDPSKWLGNGWAPGWRATQDGRRRVNVFHDGPGEADGLETYRLELQAAGYHVVRDQQPHEGGRRRLHVTRP